VVRAAFSHRRKALPRSMDMAIPGTLEPARAALGELGLDPGIRAEAVTPAQFAGLSAIIDLPAPAS
jgi:16S rRNA A1518/A1519 N6-dimethyltransferase RsmA/KsgA/DIM1 with predicted DNA glycosylase/AP lyase activity